MAAWRYADVRTVVRCLAVGTGRGTLCGDCERAKFEAAVQLVEGRAADVLAFDSYDRWHRNRDTARETFERVKAAGGRLYAVGYGWITDETYAEWKRMHQADLGRRGVSGPDQGANHEREPAERPLRHLPRPAAVLRPAGRR